MEYEWDEIKNARNKAKHGFGFDSIVEFEWETAITAVDDRALYGETRFVSYGYIKGRLHACVYVTRQSARRIISLRKANKREEASYAQTIND